ncbi:hypothetical protein J4Q44_G00314070 [Coregonus suidteri]|uniref:Uncharacterized protein n=1 Tax=Coregonus suidteri TaxID=861788 RepID=A0AAN8KT77_9TELE
MPIHGGRLRRHWGPTQPLVRKSGAGFATSSSRQRKETRAAVEMPVEKLLQKCCCWLVRHVKQKTESNMPSSPKDGDCLFFMQDLGSSILGPPPRPSPLAFSSPMPQSSSSSSRGVRRREKRAADSALDTSLTKAMQMSEDIQYLKIIRHRATSLAQRVLAPIADFMDELSPKLREEYYHQLHEFLHHLKKRTWTERLVLLLFRHLRSQTLSFYSIDTFVHNRHCFTIVPKYLYCS